MYCILYSTTIHYSAVLYCTYIQPGKKRTIKAGMHLQGLPLNKDEEKTARSFCRLCGMKISNTIHYLLLWEV